MSIAVARILLSVTRGRAQAGCRRVLAEVGEGENPEPPMPVLWDDGDDVDGR